MEKDAVSGVGIVRRDSDGFDAADVFSRSKAVLTGSLGNLIEWYEIYAYSAFSLYFAGAFFPQTDPVAQQLAAASLFAVAFFVRPLGSALFGYFADRQDRAPPVSARSRIPSGADSIRASSFSRRRSRRSVWRTRGGWYATALIFVSLLCYIFMKDMKTHSKMELSA